MGCSNTPLANCAKAGVCTKTGTVTKVSITGLGEVLVGPSVNWWSSKNWCQANGKNMIPVENFQIYRSDGQLVSTGQDSYNFACTKGKSCGNWGNSPYNAMWKGNSGIDARTLTNAVDGNGEPYRLRYSPIMVSLAEHFRSNKECFWTASVANQDSYPCHMLLIYVGPGNVTHNLGTNSSYATLCK